MPVQISSAQNGLLQPYFQTILLNCCRTYSGDRIEITVKKDDR